MKFPAGKALTVTIATALAATVFAGEDAPKKESVEAEMRIMDTSKDGRISAAEHEAGAQQMFQGMDGNQDNRVTTEEMDAAHRPLKGQDPAHGEHHGRPSHEMSSAEKIKFIDKDGDGVLTVQEHADGSKQMFSKMDGNKDGFLTAAEITAGHEKMMTAED